MFGIFIVFIYIWTCKCPVTCSWLFSSQHWSLRRYFDKHEHVGSNICKSVLLARWKEIAEGGLVGCWAFVSDFLQGGMSRKSNKGWCWNSCFRWVEGLRHFFWLQGEPDPVIHWETWNQKCTECFDEMFDGVWWSVWLMLCLDSNPVYFLSLKFVPLGSTTTILGLYLLWKLDNRQR